ncbi:MAG: DNA repair protein RecO [Gammaproteobacteria bacterium]|nr:DNA repair protein RecO [Gammaproteobacteria bacterium]
MMRINLDNKSAIVLHHYNYRDSSLIVNFFLSDFGKVSAIARGVKGKKSKQNQFALLQPFQMLSVSLTGKNELLILKSIELISDLSSESSSDLSSESSFEPRSPGWNLSGKSLYCAYYLNELLLRLLPSHTDCGEIFALYDQILSVLSHHSNQYSSDQHPAQQTSIQYEVPLRMFELKLLEYLGYGLNLSHDIQSESAIDDKKQYYYIIDAGPVENPPGDTKYLAISGQTLNDLANGQFSEQKTLQESKQLLKWALAEHLGNKPLKSRELFRQLYCSTAKV